MFEASAILCKTFTLVMEVVTDKIRLHNLVSYKIKYANK